MKKAIFPLFVFLLTLACLSSGGAPTANPQREKTPLPPKSTQAFPPAQAGAPQVPLADGRMIEFNVTPAEDNDFDASVNLAITAGASSNGVTVYWDELETAPGVFEPEVNFLEIANVYYPYKGLKISLTIGVIDTNNSRLPADLKNKAFDDPEVIQRFEKLLDWVFAQLPDVGLVVFSIGNEVDVYLAQEAGRWAQYQSFYQAVVEYSRSLRPKLLIGVKGTFGGLTGYARQEMLALNQASDVILLTYYPLNNDATVKDPSVVGGDFDTITALYPGRTVYFLEAGYPSGALCNSSEALQAEFIRQLFTAWDAHAAQVRLVSFTFLTDLSSANVEILKEYYRFDDPVFLEFLGTLGLRTFPGAGSDKEAFRVLLDEVKARK